MDLTLDRDSVCAGDDGMPHLGVVAVPDDMTLAQAITLADETHFLASVQGGATWLVQNGPGGQALAVFRLGRALYLADPQTPLRAIGEQPVLYFRYELARDPELLHAEQLGRSER